MEPVERYEVPFQLRQRLRDLQRRSFLEKAGDHFHQLTDRAKSLYETMSVKMVAASFMVGMSALNIGVDYVHEKADQHASEPVRFIAEESLPDDAAVKPLGPEWAKGWPQETTKATDRLRDIVVDPDRQEEGVRAKQSPGMTP